MEKSKFGKASFIVLLIFGLIGQLAWAVENMYFNLFVFETIYPSLDTVTLMVQLSGIVATIATLVAGAVSDKVGNRRSFISWGYIIWGITVAIFGFISNENTEILFGLDAQTAVTVTLALVVVADCVMTFFGSTANDASFNAWVTDNTEKSYRGKIEGVLAILPLIALLMVAGGFGIIVQAVGYQLLFLALGLVISACGIFGLFYIKDSPTLIKSGTLKDIVYGFKPSVIKNNIPLYLTLTLVLVYGIACQIFMPYMIIFMKEYLGFSVIEYSLVFGVAILGGAGVNLYLTRLSDTKDKLKMLYIAVAIMSLGLIGMYFGAMLNGKIVNLIVFGVFGFVMITGYILISALCGSKVRDYTPTDSVGKLQGIRMFFSVLLPMIIGPMIGNAINKARNIPLPDLGSADAMTTEFIPAPEIFLAGGIMVAVMFVLIPLLQKIVKKAESKDVKN